jgi:signal transduction histidine kinase
VHATAAGRPIGGLLELPGRLLRAPQRLRLGVVPFLLGGVIFAGTLVRVWLDSRYRITPAGVLTAAACWMGVTVACRWPRAGLGVTLAGLLGFAALSLPIVPLALCVLADLFLVGLLRPTLEAFLITLATATLGLLVAAGLRSVPFTWTTVSQLGWFFAAGAAGSGVRSQRRYAAEALARAEWAERTRDEEARERVADERLRIAGELHDAVGHRLAIINLAAGVASRVLERDPPAARTALDRIADAAGGALREMRGTLGLLRTGAGYGDPHAADTDVGTLIADARAAGLPVRLTVTGEEPHLTAVLRTTVFRLVQEALTNVVKHGSAVTTVTVSIHYGRKVVGVEVVNDGAAVTESTMDTSAHQGLQNMSGRVRALGGRMHAGPEPTGGFAVRARLPSVAAT